MTCRELAASDGSGTSRPGPALNDLPCPRMQARVRRRCTWLGLHNSTLWLGCMLLALCVGYWPVAAAMRPDRVRELRQETVNMFYHGFDNYMKIAFPEDELRPVSCSPLTRDRENPRNVELNDVLGNYSLTLIDSLSTLAILASAPPEDGETGPKALRDFQDGVAALVEQYGDGTSGPSGVGLRGRGFDVDSKVQVFETVIRGVGGLLSAHLFAIGALPITGYNPRHPGDDLLHPRPVVWPNGFRYDGQLLRLALDLGQRLLPAFYTRTGMPYPRVNLRHGIPFYTNSPLHEAAAPGTTADGSPEITETCSAGAGSLVLEFTVLSRLTGDPRFEQLAKRAFWAVWYRKSQIGLIGAGVDAEQGHWIGSYAVIGAGADSFFEYALKSHILLSGHELPNQTAVRPDRASDGWLDPNTLFNPLSDAENSPDSFLEAWHHAHASIKRHLYSDRDHPHYENVNLWTGSLASSWVDSLGAYYSGLLVLAGEVSEAIETNLLYAAIWTRYAALPERWSIREKTVEGGLGWWPLRPEFIESTYHLYRATKDPWYLYVGEMVLRDIARRCWTPCGWAGLQNVLDGQKSDRMESFFLGETAKYMYLLYDDQHPLNSLDAAYVFNTEGHPLIIPKAASASGRRRPRAERKDLAIYNDDAFTNSCPPRPSATPISGSVIAARDDIYHAARMLDLHLLSTSPRTVDGGQMSGQHMARSNFTLFPWTLPSELLPSNGTCAKVHHPTELVLEFASNAGQMVGGGAFNFMIGAQNLERLSADRIRVTSLSGLKLTMHLEGDLEQEWRVTKVNGIPLGRDEFLVFDRSILGEVSDPRFNLVRDPVMVKLQHLHQVDIPEDDADTVDDDAPQASNHEPGPEPEPLEDGPNPSVTVTDLGSLVKSLLSRITSSLDNIQLPTSLPRIGATLLPFNLVLNTTAITSTGIGSAPLPPGASPPSAAQRHRTPPFGPVPDALFPWSTIYASPDDACSSPLPDAAPRDHQIILIRRGGCSFSTKLANIPAFTPSPDSLQLVIVVSDDGDDADQDNRGGGGGGGGVAGLVRPLLDEVQRTPGGIQRRHPIAMVMVGGGEAVFRQLEAASRVGVVRRYFVESQGVKIRNIIVDEGGDEMDW
ncbi:glycoside hydrolase family 47 protein [Thermothelomyces thermophilus ATCC 42464]|uniref:alpha-1,2-Mannosidase n=1 Tax=Thermothelomyces thermophilus (strain ATCC 42464 / BCRC 31852 / DSM 1799) TaxID=573729 RepID=G2Q0V9_THET4|nr:glycoside hydrolase family 47 protein [Thermothelomyces thermophilus ATCC 42464]AEO53259.1 glycoside hydrolase family 47 protein [Thermothelomyces thermophilus ATCC 42464]